MRRLEAEVGAVRGGLSESSALALFRPRWPGEKPYSPKGFIRWAKQRKERAEIGARLAAEKRKVTHALRGRGLRIYRGKPKVVVQHAVRQKLQDLSLFGANITHQLNLSALAGEWGCSVRAVRSEIAYWVSQGQLERMNARGGRGRGITVKIPRPDIVWDRAGGTPRIGEGGIEKKLGSSPLILPSSKKLEKETSSGLRKKVSNIQIAAGDLLEGDRFATTAGPQSWWYKQIKPSVPDSVELQRRSTAVAEGARSLELLAGDLEWLATQNDSEIVRKVGQRMVRHTCWNLGFSPGESFQVARFVGEALAERGSLKSRRASLNNWWAWANRCDRDELAVLSWPAQRDRIRRWCADPPRNFEGAARGDDPQTQLRGARIGLADEAPAQRKSEPSWASAATNKNPLNPTRPSRGDAGTSYALVHRT